MIPTIQSAPTVTPWAFGVTNPELDKLFAGLRLIGLQALRARSEAPPLVAWQPATKSRLWPRRSRTSAPALTDSRPVAWQPAR